MKRMDYSMGLFVYYFGSKKKFKEVMLTGLWVTKEKDLIFSVPSGNFGHAYFEKVCSSWNFVFFSKMAPQTKPLCSRRPQRNSV